MRILLVILLTLWAPGPLFSQSTPITHIYGANVACNPLLVTCSFAPLLNTVAVLCNGSVNCPEALNADPSNSLNFYGVNTTCVRSTNGGSVWAQCASQPPTTGGAVLAGVAATSSGAVISAASTGTNCVIGRSINGTTSWTTIYNAAPICQGDPGQSVIRCVGNVCIVGTNAGGRPGVMASTDDGQSFAVTFQSATKSGTPTAVYFDGTNGIIVTNFRDSDNIIYTTGGPLAWTNSPNALGITLCYGTSSSPNYGLVTFCTTAATRRLVNVTNGTITNLTAPNLSNDGFPRFLQFAGNHYVSSNATSGCGFWNALGAATAFNQLTCNATFNTIGGEFFQANGILHNTTRFNGVNAIYRTVGP